MRMPKKKFLFIEEFLPFPGRAVILDMFEHTFPFRADQQRGHPKKQDFGGRGVERNVVNFIPREIEPKISYIVLESQTKREVIPVISGVQGTARLISQHGHGFFFIIFIDPRPYGGA